MPQDKKFYKDGTIDVAGDTMKTVAEIVQEQIKQSRKHNESYYSEAKKSEQQYAQVTKSMAQGKVQCTPWKGASDPFIPLTEWTIDAIHARVISALFSQEPYMTAVPVEGRDVDNSQAVTDFVDMAFREIVELKKNFEYYVKQMLKLPFAVIKYDWEQLFDTHLSKENAIVLQKGRKKEFILPDEPDSIPKMAEMLMNGWQPVDGELQEVWVRSEQQLVDQPVLKYIKFEDYVWAPNTKKGQRPYWEGDRFYMNIGSIQSMEDAGIFIKGATDKLRKQRQGKTEDMTVNEKILDERTHNFECYHWFGKLPFNQQNEIDFQSTNVVDQEVHLIISYAEQQILKINFWEYQRKPFPERVYIREGFEETDGFGFRSMVKKLRKIQEEVNVIEKTIMDNAMLSMNKIFIKKGMPAGDSSWERPVVFPGVQWNVDRSTDIQVLDVGDVKSIGQELIQELLSYAERVSNISVFSTGANRQGGSKTASEVSATIQEGNIGIDKFIQRVHDVLRTVCKWTVDYYHERMPVGLERRIIGPDGSTIFPTRDGMALFQEKGVSPEWSSDDLAGQYDFIWKGTRVSANKELQIAVSNDLMQMYLPQPMVQNNMLATWEILKKGLIAREVKDWQKILPPREAIIAEMQIKDAQQETEKTIDEMATVEERAGEILAEQGVNPLDLGVQG